MSIVEESKLKFLIEEITEGDRLRLEDAILKAGYSKKDIINLDCATVEYEDFLDNKIMVHQYNTIVFGSIQLCRFITKNSYVKNNVVPGPFYNKQFFECLSYYRILGKDLLLNHDYMIVPFYDLENKIDDIFKDRREIFIRPNSPDKDFTGQVVFKEDFLKKINQMTWGDSVSQMELCYISNATNISKEYRCVITKEGFLTGSLYRNGTVHLTSEDIPSEVINKANEAAFDIYHHKDMMYNTFYFKDREVLSIPMLVVDIAVLRNDEVKVIEIGSLSCAGLYDCSREKIINYIKEYYGN